MKSSLFLVILVLLLALVYEAQCGGTTRKVSKRRIKSNEVVNPLFAPRKADAIGGRKGGHSEYDEQDEECNAAVLLNEDDGDLWYTKCNPLKLVDGWEVYELPRNLSIYHGRCRDKDAHDTAPIFFTNGMDSMSYGCQPDNEGNTKVYVQRFVVEGDRPFYAMRLMSARNLRKLLLLEKKNTFDFLRDVRKATGYGPIYKDDSANVPWARLSQQSLDLRVVKNVCDLIQRYNLPFDGYSEEETVAYPKPGGPIKGVRHNDPIMGGGFHSEIMLCDPWTNETPEKRLHYVGRTHFSLDSENYITPLDD